MRVGTGGGDAAGIDIDGRAGTGGGDAAGIDIEARAGTGGGDATGIDIEARVGGLAAGGAKWSGPLPIRVWLGWVPSGARLRGMGRGAAGSLNIRSSPGAGALGPRVATRLMSSLTAVDSVFGLPIGRGELRSVWAM